VYIFYTVLQQLNRDMESSARDGEARNLLCSEPGGYQSPHGETTGCRGTILGHSGAKSPSFPQQELRQGKYEPTEFHAVRYCAVWWEVVRTYLAVMRSGVRSPSAPLSKSTSYNLYLLTKKRSRSRQSHTRGECYGETGGLQRHREAPETPAWVLGM
jgi:hypothetical protein